MGYEFINFDNWWNGTQGNPIADYNYYRNNSYIYHQLHMTLFIL